MKETSSANVSLSAEAESRIPSILDFSVETSFEKRVSIEESPSAIASSSFESLVSSEASAAASADSSDESLVSSELSAASLEDSSPEI